MNALSIAFPSFSHPSTFCCIPIARFMFSSSVIIATNTHMHMYMHTHTCIYTHICIYPLLSPLLALFICTQIQIWPLELSTLRRSLLLKETNFSSLHGPPVDLHSGVRPYGIYMMPVVMSISIAIVVSAALLGFCGYIFPVVLRGHYLATSVLS